MIELMIVVAIIGILAAISIPKFAALIRKSSAGQAARTTGELWIACGHTDTKGSLWTSY